jgi:class 3 adenylate cyclase
MEQQIRFCNTPDGARIAYATVGQGPHLVYLGMCVTHLELEWEDPAFRTFFEKLGRHYTIVRYDRRGVGLSDREKKDFSLEAELQELESVINHLQLKQMIILGAHRGGPLAVAYATKYPQSVTNLILYGTYARGGTVAKDKVKESMISLIRAHWGIGSKTLADIHLPEADSKQIEWFDRFQRESATAEFTADSMAAVYRLDVADLLPSVSVPTIVIHRQKDRAMPFRQGMELAASIPNARFVSFGGSIHAPWMGDTDSVLRAISEFLGDPFAPEDGRQLLAVLFTDIVSSTQRAAELGDRRWRELLERYHELVRKELVRFQGREIDAAGDGFFATFDRPARAIHCARAINDAVQEIGLEIRTGLHMGECEVGEEAIRGIAVHIGARAMAIAEGGEILVTNTVKDMVAGSDIRFEDRGIHDLKGIPGQWHLFAVKQTRDA